MLKLFDIAFKLLAVFLAFGGVFYGLLANQLGSNKGNFLIIAGILAGVIVYYFGAWQVRLIKGQVDIQNDR